MTVTIAVTRDEYKVETIAFSDLEARLNELAKDDWELHSMLTSWEFYETETMGVFVFQRTVWLPKDSEK